MKSIIFPNLLFDSSNVDDQSQREETAKLNQSMLKLQWLNIAYIWENYFRLKSFCDFTFQCYKSDLDINWSLLTTQYLDVSKTNLQTWSNKPTQMIKLFLLSLKAASSKATCYYIYFPLNPHPSFTFLHFQLIFYCFMYS